jgi:hypothetical protein
VSWKLSRTVLRGAVGGNAARLLDQKLNRKTQQPFAIAMKDGPLYALAGLWEKWKECSPRTVPLFYRRTSFAITHASLEQHPMALDGEAS